MIRLLTAALILSGCSVPTTEAVSYQAGNWYIIDRIATGEKYTSDSARVILRREGNAVLATSYGPAKAHLTLWHDDKPIHTILATFR